MLVDSKLVTGVVGVICEVFEEASIQTLNVEAPLSSQVNIDSLNFMEFVTALEDRFDVIISDDLLIPDNFDSVPQIAALVERLQ